MYKSRLASSVLLVGVFIVACGPPPYTMNTPETFKRYEESRDFKLITPDGVLLKAREVDNYPKAGLAFWTDALSRHLESQGYILKDKDCFKTDKGRDGCTIDFMLPYGTDDWVLSETIFVVGDRVILVEAGAPFDRFTLVEAELKKAIKTFDPNS
jgi:hypothetical protein